MEQPKLSSFIKSAFFSRRGLVLGIFAVVTLVMVYFASQLRVDASFEKNIPLQHEYMRTYLEHQDEFGGANRVLIALEDTSGDIFNENFFRALLDVTNRVEGLDAANKSQVKSLFSPSSRFVEVIEDGLAGGPIIPADFDYSERALEKVRTNVLKAGVVGRMVANDFGSAMVTGQLLAFNPETKSQTDFVIVAHQLEQIRQDIESEYDGIKLHIIGFAKMIGDVSNGAQQVVLFFLAAFIITALLVYWYSHSIMLTLLPLACSVIAVIWQLGLLTVFGFGIDPMSILVPFLIFAIGVSHGVQMINAVGKNVAAGTTPMNAACAACCRLFIPGMVALLSDTVGFLTLLLIDIQIIKELAITASLGVAVIILTNLILLPVLLSYVKFKSNFAEKVEVASARQDKLWGLLSSCAKRRRAKVILSIALVLAALGYWQAQNMKIGDLHAGAPALRPDSVYNQDTQFITDHFAIGTDLMSIFAVTEPDGCTQYDIMNAIDEFHWYLANQPGVQSVISLPAISKILNSGFYEGSLKWRVLPRQQATLVQSIQYLETSTGLFNRDCSVMPIMVFTEDHKAETISLLVEKAKAYIAEHPNDKVKFELAAGPVGVMAATNEAVEAAQLPMLAGVYAAVILLCLISFRSIRSTLCVVIPLALVSILAQALMTWLEIGLTVATLPVIALGVGVGVDYGIYIFSRMIDFIRAGEAIKDAFFKTLRLTGNAVFFTGLTLAIGVSTWMFSPLQFQADMGVLLTFMFLFNMLGAVIVLPALAAFLYRR